ncbi:hypothetical protein [Simplicispira piscis]
MTHSYDNTCGASFTPTHSIYRHSPLMCDRPELYAIIAANCELARMQGAKRWHVMAVVDDFGNLVAVPSWSMQ